MSSPWRRARRAAETAHRRTGTDNIIHGDHHLIRDVEPGNGRRRTTVSIGRKTAAARAGHPRRAARVVVDGSPRRRRKRHAARGRPPRPSRAGHRGRRRRTRRRGVATGSRVPVPRTVRVTAPGHVSLMMDTMMVVVMLVQPVVGRYGQIARLDAVRWLH